MILDMLMSLKYYWVHAKTQQLKALIERVRTTIGRAQALKRLRISRGSQDPTSSHTPDSTKEGSAG